MNIKRKEELNPDLFPLEDLIGIQTFVNKRVTFDPLKCTTIINLIRNSEPVENLDRVYDNLSRQLQDLAATPRTNLLDRGLEVEEQDLQIPQYYLKSVFNQFLMNIERDQFEEMEALQSDKDADRIELITEEVENSDNESETPVQIPAPSIIRRSNIMIRDIDISAGEGPSGLEGFVPPEESPDAFSEDMAQNIQVMIDEMRVQKAELNELKTAVMSVVSLTSIMREELEIMKTIRTDMHVIASTIQSVAVNLEAAVKNIAFQVAPVSMGEKVETEGRSYTEAETKTINSATEIYEKYLDKYKFKGLTKEVFIQIHLSGGYKSYMDKHYPKHTVTADTFEGIIKGKNIKFYQILDRELIRLTSPMHKSSYISAPQGAVMFAPSKSSPYVPQEGDTYGAEGASPSSGRLTAEDILKLI